MIAKATNDGAAARIGGKTNVSILSSRDATAHAPAPSWMDVDRDALKGRINSTPRRDELVQIPITEQLIVELYSK
jgi:small subunit ribosomal protein S4